MDFLARFIREHYLQLEEQEAAPLACSGESHIDGHVRRRAETHARATRAVHTGSPTGDERARTLRRPLLPAIAGSVILRDREPYWGRFWINGNYYADEGSLSRAKRTALERAHAAALHEDAGRLGDTSGKPHRETSEQAERASLGRSLVASIAIAGIYYEITPKGREALQSVLTPQTKDATRSGAVGGQSRAHG